MATEHFCLRWNNHQSTLVSVFDNLLESGTLVDCTLAADGRYLKAHKVVLSACSPYLGMLLSQHYDKHPIIILKDVKFDELKAMLDYMYRGEVNISQEQLSTFLKAAETLQIKGLTDTGGEEGNGIPQNRPPSSNSTVSIPNDDPPSPGEGGSSPGPRKRKRNKHSDEPPDSSEIQPKIATGDASDRLNREGVCVTGTVANTGSPSSKNVSFGNVKREPTDTDGDGVMSVDDSGDSAMMSRPGPSSSSSTNNKNSPWLLSADSTAEEMQMTPGQGTRAEAEDIKVESEIKEEVIDLDDGGFEPSKELDEIKTDPVTSNSGNSEGKSCELFSENLAIINSSTLDELIIPDMIDSTKPTNSIQERCNARQQSELLKIVSSCHSVSKNLITFSSGNTQIGTNNVNRRGTEIPPSVGPKEHQIQNRAPRTHGVKFNYSSNLRPVMRGVSKVKSATTQTSNSLRPLSNQVNKNYRLGSPNVATTASQRPRSVPPNNTYPTSNELNKDLTKDPNPTIIRNQGSNKSVPISPKEVITKYRKLLPMPSPQTDNSASGLNVNYINNPSQSEILPTNSIMQTNSSNVPMIPKQNLSSATTVNDNQLSPSNFQVHQNNTVISPANVHVLQQPKQLHAPAIQPVPEQNVPRQILTFATPLQSVPTSQHMQNNVRLPLQPQFTISASQHLGHSSTLPGIVQHVSAANQMMVNQPGQYGMSQPVFVTSGVVTSASNPSPPQPQTNPPNTKIVYARVNGVMKQFTIVDPLKHKPKN